MSRMLKKLSWLANGFLWKSPNMGCLSYAKSLRSLRIGYAPITRSYNSSPMMYQAAINHRRVDSLRPITSVHKVWDEYLLSEMITACGLDTSTRLDERPRRHLQWLHDLIVNRDRGFKIIGLIGASFSSCPWKKVLKGLKLVRQSSQLLTLRHRL